MSQVKKIIDVVDLKCKLGKKWVLDGVTFDVREGEIFAIVGGSGSGKTTILRNVIQLTKPSSGKVEVLGIDTMHCSRRDAAELRQRWGVLFQSGALFSSLTVLENILFPLKEFTRLPDDMLTELALLKIRLAGLPLDAAEKLPAELSGGMLKRAALARAIALDPELLFLDEPTSGLDPKGAEALDDLVLYLRNALGISIVMVTHDLDSLWRVADRVAFIGDGKIIAASSMKELVKHSDERIQAYFSGARGKIRDVLNSG